MAPWGWKTMHVAAGAAHRRTPGWPRGHGKRAKSQNERGLRAWSRWTMPQPERGGQGRAGRAAAGPLLGGVAQPEVAEAVLVHEQEHQPALALAVRADLGIGVGRQRDVALVDPHLPGTDVAAQAADVDVPRDRPVLVQRELPHRLAQGLVAGRDHLAIDLARGAVADVGASHVREHSLAQPGAAVVQVGVADAVAER